MRLLRTREGEPGDEAIMYQKGEPGDEAIMYPEGKAWE